MAKSADSVFFLTNYISQKIRLWSCALQTFNGILTQYPISDISDPIGNNPGPDPDPMLGEVTLFSNQDLDPTLDN
jgi:hypothetical protein